ncbi:MAG: DUF692 domain-containing protein [Psychrobium sp.]
MFNYLNQPIPACAGVGLKPQHIEQILSQSTTVAWFEIHAENYMGKGGSFHRHLERIRHEFPLSIHGVGLSLGSSDGLCLQQLSELKRLVERYQPALVSEHLSWSRHGAHSLNDLLPMPYTKETLQVFVSNISHTQEVLGREILVENPSSYFELNYNEYAEQEFLIEVAKQSGCKILLDVNNVYVSAMNHGFDAKGYIDAIAPEQVGEIHLAGHSVQKLLDSEIRIDDHGSKVCDAVWQLYQHTLNRIGAKPTLIEWDHDVPTWQTLEAQASIANDYLGQVS